MFSIKILVFFLFKFAFSAPPVAQEFYQEFGRFQVPPIPFEEMQKYERMVQDMPQESLQSYTNMQPIKPIQDVQESRQVSDKVLEKMLGVHLCE